MELFLLLSLGMSVMVFISIALNQAPVAPPVSDHNLEPTFQLESSLHSIENLRAQLPEIEGMPRKIIRLPEEHLLPTEIRVTAATA